MSLKQQVLTNNALKARIVETSYSKVDTVTTKVRSAEGTEDSTVTSVVKKTDVVKEEETVKTREHKESIVVTTEKSTSDYSDIEKYPSSSYKGPELSDSIFQSDAEEMQGAKEQSDVDMEAKTETENEVEKIMGSSRNETGIDPTLNVYEDKDEPEIETKEETVLTEMPLMSQEQYIAMEENDFDELHEEYFNEEVIVQQYLSPSKTTTTSEDKQKNETVISEVIEIDSSSSSNSSNSSVASNSTNETEKIPSESESESDSNEDKNVSLQQDEKGIVREEVVHLDDGSIDSNEEQNSVTSEESRHYKEDSVYAQSSAASEGSHQDQEGEEQKSIISEGSRNVEDQDQEDEEQKSVTSETNRNEMEDIVSVGSREEQRNVASEGSHQDQEDEEQKSVNVDSKESEASEVNRYLDTIFEEDTQEQQIIVDSKLEEYAHLPETEVVESKPTTPNQSKSDLEYSVLSQGNLSRSLGLTLHKTDLTYSLETPNKSHVSKSDLEFTVLSGETSKDVFPTTSTPFLNKTTEEQQDVTSTPKTRTRRSKSADLPSEPMETRRSTLRKRTLSTDCTDGSNVEKPKTRKRSLTTKLPAILEKNKEVETKSTKRITRRQKNVVTLDSSESENEERGPALAPIDPLKLLDKPTFKGIYAELYKKILSITKFLGKPDPEEARLRGKSPSTISRTSSTSELQSASETTITRKRSFTKAKTISPPPLTIRTRSRTKSVDLPPKREPRKRQSVKDDESNVTAEVSSTRKRSTRAKSISSVKSG